MLILVLISLSLQTLTDTLCKELGKDALRLTSKVLSLSYSHGEKSALENWSIAYASNIDKQSKYFSFDAVIMAVSIVSSLTIFFDTS